MLKIIFYSISAWNFGSHRTSETHTFQFNTLYAILNCTKMRWSKNFSFSIEFRKTMKIRFFQLFVGQQRVLQAFPMIGQKKTGPNIPKNKNPKKLRRDVLNFFFNQIERFFRWHFTYRTIGQKRQRALTWIIV